MTPVSLRLSNFLSYGDDAPVLDFAAITIACISGANGQGKSSLLDAITWALWGEARKTGDARKPDEHLLRLGARRMAVEFTFDHLGERYRVRRAYHQSGSGKTSKPELELTVLDDGGAARVLTAATVSETQERLDQLLRVDYDTFVNASFLVQGRADEFARKKPRERKETLIRLLGLSRYERLEARAAERAAAARQTADRHDAELARYDAELGDVPALEEERTRVNAALDAARADLAAAHAAADTLRTDRAPLDAQRAALDEVGVRRRAVDDERRTATDRRAALDERLAASADLLARADAIEAAVEEHAEARAAFDALAALHADALRLDQQIADLDREMERRRDAHARAVHALDVQEAADRARLDALVQRLATRPDVQQRLAEARAAQEQFAASDTVRQRLDEAQRQSALARDRLKREHDALAQQAAQLGQQIDALRARAGDLEQIERLLGTARRAKERLDALRQQEADLRTRGIEARDDHQRLAEAVQQADAARLDQIERLNRLRTAPVGGDCPTCGTPLTDAHRRTLLVDAERTLARLADEHARLDARRAEADASVQALRAAFQQNRDEQKALGSPDEQVLRLEHQRDAHADALVQIDGLAADRADVQRRLDEKAYLPDVRADYERWKKVAADLAFDADAHERLRRTAADVDRHANTLADLDRADRDADELRLRLTDLAQQRTDLAEKDVRGEVLLDLPAQQTERERERAALGFDADAYDAARTRVEATRSAQDAFAALRKAEREQNALLAEHARFAEQLAALEAEAAALDARLDGRAALDAALAALDERLAAALAAAAEAQQSADALGHQLGGLDAQLTRAEALRAHRADLVAQAQDAKREQALFRHLKTAFSRDGIPSLILEDTLPDLEARANDLLGRLTDGRLSLRLETLADKKTGGTKETLDLLISDESGATRPYETYSGGEAFRISFALRIALSQLLAARADVAVRMLVIDEGFGTQDPQGVQQLVEAIRLVQDDFDKVLVITHLDALKNAFPTRIEVRKDPVRGSTFEVLEGG